MRFVMPGLGLINVSQNITKINQQLRDCELLFSRRLHSVFLLAVSKGQSIAQIERAIQAGHTAFGENHVQEALPKIIAFAARNVTWHFIGLVQSNKTKKITEHFSWVHSITNPQVAQRLNDQRPLHLPPLNICLQVNVNQEASKAGVSMNEVIPLAEYCKTLPQLKLRGLMTIPPFQTTFPAQRAEFEKLTALFHALNAKDFKLDTLSMGMSNDMQAAIAAGATMVRIGTAIFGGRLI
jgi:pyridoxal phosphate enzyme (YggS family)